jgi:hypothetical protein
LNSSWAGLSAWNRIQRNFEPRQRQVELWGKTQITDDTAKLIFYSAFINGKLEAPRSLPEIHRLYFEPQYPEFARTMWSLSNAFTSAFKKLDPVPQFKATAKLGAFLAQLPKCGKQQQMKISLLRSVARQGILRQPPEASSHLPSTA